MQHTDLTRWGPDGQPVPGSVSGSLTSPGRGPSAGYYTARFRCPCKAVLSSQGIRKIVRDDILRWFSRPCASCGLVWCPEAFAAINLVGQENFLVADLLDLAFPGPGRRGEPPGHDALRWPSGWVSDLDDELPGSLPGEWPPAVLVP